MGFAAKVLTWPAANVWWKNTSHAKTQRRKEKSQNTAVLCVFAPLREKYSPLKTLFVQSIKYELKTRIVE